MGAEIQWSPNESFIRCTEEVQLCNISSALSQVLCQGIWLVETQSPVEAGQLSF